MATATNYMLTAELAAPTAGSRCCYACAWFTHKAEPEKTGFVKRSPCCTGGTLADRGLVDSKVSKVVRDVSGCGERASTHFEGMCTKNDD